MRTIGRTIAATALALGSFALAPTASASEPVNAAGLPCEYGSEEGPSYDLGPACDQAYYQAWDVIWLARDLAFNTIDYANEQANRVCQEIPPYLTNCD